jgi:oxygen-independent coproporphyrinogen-3 oxidase
VAALCREAEVSRGFFPKGAQIKTVYFGGGTPSLLLSSEFSEICSALAASYDLGGVEEFTVEVNPDDICRKGGEELLNAYRDCGVNRVSIGVQSFHDDHLRWMNRRHDAAEAERAVRILTDKFSNVSLDLIFGYAGLTDTEWEQDIRKAAGLGVQHISSYQMSLDPGSMLSKLADKGRYSEPDEELCRRQYFLLQDILDEEGFVQYEISNFCRPGYHSRHNSAYWRREPYLGLGPGAHSFDGDRRRSWNADDLGRWLDGAPKDGETLTDIDIYNEKVMLGLRTSEGVDASLIGGSAEHNLSFDAATGRYSIGRTDRFVSDSIIRDLLK